MLAVTTPILTTCSTVWRTELTPIDQVRGVDESAPFLKCHTPQGAVYVLREWRIDHASQVIIGTGVLYDSGRRIVEEGYLRVAFGQITLVETNFPESVTLPHLIVVG